MKDRMKTVGFRITDELAKALKKCALKERVPESVIVRRALGKELGVEPPKATW